MILSQMKLWNFRKFKNKENEEAGLVVNFHKGLNALIGENDAGIQIIISTHSTVLTSKINVKNIIFLKDDCAYDLSPEKTKLAKGDYLFL